MNILFLNPPTKDKKKYIREGRCMQLTSSWAAIWPPLSLAILARIAKDLGHEAKIFDANVEDIEFDDVASIADRADILVLNTSFPSINLDLEAARIIKKRRRDIIVISFGVFFTMLEEEGVPRDASIDYAIIGEPEETFKELLNALEHNMDKNSIDGLIFFEGNSIRKTKNRALIADLDCVPVPARSLLKNSRYVLPQNGEPFTLINSSRGCPFQCTFCIVKTYYGMKIRRHSISYIMDEITECVNKHQIRNFLLWEEAFTLDKRVIREFCDALAERGLNINWAVTTRADSLDIEHLKLMKRAGCFLVGMGIESSSQDILDRSKKQSKLADIVRGVDMCREAGIPVMGHFIFGLPGETRKTARQTIEFIKKVPITYMQCYSAVPYPKTEFGELAKKSGWIIPSASGEGPVTARDDTRHRLPCDWSKYDFGGKSIVNMPGISAKEISSFRRSAFRNFYFRPGKILQELRKLKSIRAFMQALSFLKWMK